MKTLAVKYNLSGHAIALRWALYHSALKPENGDGIVIGCSNVKQMEQNLTWVEQGPLNKELVEGMENVWRTVEPTAPSYHK